MLGVTDRLHSGDQHDGGMEWAHKVDHKNTGGNIKRILIGTISRTYRMCDLSARRTVFNIVSSSTDTNLI